MKSVQVKLSAVSDFSSECKEALALKPQLVLLFGHAAAFEEDGVARKVTKLFSESIVIGCSTAGEIASDGAHDNMLVLTCAKFANPTFKTATVAVNDMNHSFDAGKALASQLKSSDLTSVFLLGPGIDINGSGLVQGMQFVLGKDIPITGGLAGDGGAFKKTYTLLNQAVSDRAIVALGLCGNEVQVGFGSMGGWQTFGPIRRVTKSKANVMYELDGKPALELYKKYLGEKAKDLPVSGLLFPFALLKDNQDDSGLIRTILGVDEAAQSLIFAGDIPDGGLVRLMHATHDALIDGAKQAAEEVTTGHGIPGEQKGFGVLISCVGRKLVMGDDVEDELDAVREVLGDSTVTGFYSYGEICPQTGFSECRLHNQTMTITYFWEKKAAA
jgi:hypothetical protein